MKDLTKNRLTIKTEFVGARHILESLPMLIKKFDIDEFNIKHMGDTEATFRFTTKVEPPCDMIITISRDYKDILFLLEYEGRGITESMYLVKNGEVVNDEIICDEILNDDDEGKSLIDSMLDACLDPTNK
jgi:hypothetical protein